MEFKESHALKIVSRTICFIKLLDIFFIAKAVSLLLKKTLEVTTKKNLQDSIKNQK